MRLIDADKLADALRNVETSLARNGVYLVKNNASIYKMVENQPTAYDVDKVVDELKFATKKGVLNVCDFTGPLGTEKYKGSFVNTQHAIDIVKRGGVNE